MKAFWVGGLAAAVCVTAWAANDDPIGQRQELMGETREALKPMVKMVRGEIEFDAAMVADGLRTMQHTAETAGGLFPPGSESGGDTEARSTIWSDRVGFEQALADYAAAVETAIAAAPQSAEALQAVLGGITRGCKGCHDGYRVDDD